MNLKVENLYKSFNEKEVLHGISFEIKSGKALGLLGRNGAGKTTTIRILMNVFKANQGEILLNGKKFNPKSVKIGYLPEERGLYPKRTVIEQMHFLAELKGVSKANVKTSTEKWLKKLEVDQYAKVKLETLSKGNQQKVQLAQTLVNDPDIIILDEPFSGLDPVNSQVLKDVIKELIQSGKIVIFSSHQMSYVEEFCEEIVIINKGEVVLNGKIKEIKQQFGQNRLILRTSNYSTKELSEYFKKNLVNFIKSYELSKEGMIIELQNNIKRNDLLTRLLEDNVEIECFALYEPSLNDIFVKKAGDKI